MSMFTLSTGEPATPLMDKGSGTFDNTPLPEGTTVIGEITRASWKDGYGDNPRFINIGLKVAEPEEYKNKYIWNKLHVNDKSDNKSDRARKILKTIDDIAGGHLQAHKGDLDDETIAGALIGTLLTVRVGYYDMDGAKGNYFSHVFSKETQMSPVQPAAVVLKASAPEGGEKLTGDTIPF